MHLRSLTTAFAWENKSTMEVVVVMDTRRWRALLLSIKSSLPDWIKSNSLMIVLWLYWTYPSSLRVWSQTVTVLKSNRTECTAFECVCVVKGSTQTPSIFRLIRKLFYYFCNPSARTYILWARPSVVRITSHSPIALQSSLPMTCLAFYFGECRFYCSYFTTLATTMLRGFCSYCIVAATNVKMKSTLFQMATATHSMMPLRCASMV